MQASFKTVGLLGKNQPEDVGEALQQLIELLQQRNMPVLLEADLGPLVDAQGVQLASREDIGASADLAIVIGGDGSLLGAARTLAKFETPVIGVNRGRLGFLTDISPDEMSQQIPAILDGNYEAENRFLLDAQLYRDGRVVDVAEALNDVVIDSGSSTSHLIPIGRSHARKKI